MNSLNENILYWNCANGLYNKLNIIKQNLEDYGPEIYFIAESNLDTNMNQNVLKQNGYEFMTSSTASEDYKSRICSYFKTSWEPNLQYMGNRDEVIILENKLKQKSIIG